MEVRFQPRQGYVSVEVGGPFDAQAARAAVGRIRGECARLGVASVFVDARGLESTVTIADRFDVARSLAEGCAAPVRFAVLVKPEQMVTKTLEDSATNRGVPVRTTASIEEAYGFLGIAPPG